MATATSIIMTKIDATPTPTATPKDWTTLVNTIGTAVGPILTLFGEQPTKQFLSTSMGWQDDILIAVGPIGIITILISAIRVGGYNRLKAFIGRARESRTTVEQEFLSSTSKEVCELWSGDDIVRVTGKPGDHRMENMVIVERTTSDCVTRYELLDSTEAYEQGLLILDGLSQTGKEAQQSRPSVDSDALKHLETAAPSLTFSVPGTIVDRQVLWFWAVCGLLLQLFTLTFPALATYYFRWLRAGGPIAHYAYGCFASGTTAIIFGLFLCGYVIETSTTEHVFRPPRDDEPGSEQQSQQEKARVKRILRIQFACNVGGQDFPAFVILNDPNDTTIRTSRLDGKTKYTEPTVLFATVLTVMGFIVQLIGLAALHWSATVTVLVVSLLMTMTRAWLRRGLSNRPVCIRLPETNVLPWLAFRLVRDDWEAWADSSKDAEPQKFSKDTGWGLLTEEIQSYGRENNQQLNMKAATLKRAKSMPNIRTIGLRFCAPASYRQCPEIECLLPLAAKLPSLPLADCGQIASTLAHCMLVIMRFMGEHSRQSKPNRNWITWKTRDFKTGLSHAPPWEWSVWQVDVQRGQGIVAPWIIRICGENLGFRPVEQEEPMNEDLTAGLTLWLYSLGCAKKHSRSDTSNAEIIRNGISHSGRTGKMGLGSRIVGNDTSSLTLDMLQKMGLSSTRHDPDDRGDTIVSGPRAGYDPKWPIFGLYYSSLQNVKEPDTDPLETTFTTRAPSDQDASRDFIHQSNVEHTLEQECALEVLSLFMLSVCKCVASVEHTNKVIDGIAQRVVEAGLVGSVQEAKVVLVPAFARFNLLPEQRARGVQDGIAGSQ